MDIRIGILNSPREITFETAQPASEIEKTVSTALESGASFFKLVDDKDKLYLIPTVSFGYIEVGSEVSRRVGFVA